MKLLSLINMFPAFSFWLYLLLFIFKLCSNTTTAIQISGNNTDHVALLKFKESISNDPFEILATWNASTHFCNWHGITCSPKQQRVTDLDLQGYKLHGSLSPHIGNLSLIRNLNLAMNSFIGNIPHELGHLLQLQQLVLANNSFRGQIPINLSNCSNLISLDLYGNNLTGKIPFQIGSLKKLQVLILRGNKFISGGLLPLVNLSSLTTLSATDNSLEGEIPQEICLLRNLQTLSVSINKLSGTFPSCLFNMSSLTLISAAMNNLTGSLPLNMFYNLPKLKILTIGTNNLSGPIPTSIANTSLLNIFDISKNQFVGQVPSLEKLQHLERLNLGYNNLGENSSTDLEFVKTLTNYSKFDVLSLSFNNFGGKLPNSLGNTSTKLTQLYISHNHISGEIPSELGNLVDLTILNIGFNNFEGTIPPTFGKFQKMQSFVLNGNKLTGDIPPFIGNLSQLYNLGMEQNMLEGNIPLSIGNCQNLQYLVLKNNKLRGTIPLEILSLSSLLELDLSQNSLSGSLPKEVGKLNNINTLSISDNHLSGDIPGTIGECSSSEYLYLQGNSFNGTIPSSLSSIKGLKYLDLSRNQLSGSIPHVLQNISVLENLNVSFNFLEGEVPTKGVFGNASGLGVIGNKKLCGGISQLHLPPCSIKSTKPPKHRNIKVIVVIVCVISFLLILAFLTIYWMGKRKKKSSSNSPTIDQLAKISYQDLHQGTDGFSTQNLIGSGNFGSVYRGNLVSEDKVVAIKVLNLQKKGAHKSFIAECNALKNIRHRNLVRILTCCSSTDYKGQEFKALVFDYMKNGSLEEWVHPRTTSVELHTTIDLDQRLNIIIDVASALHYLHHECEQVVLHCDLKPSNVLLDDDMVAHVSDFGISKLVSTIDNTSHKKTISSTLGVKGTIGYAPPEYGMGSEVSKYGDMYSFGVLILEILTGRRPTDEMLEEGQSLHMFVQMSFPDNIIQILDPYIIPRDEEATIEDGNIRNLILTDTAEKCLVSLFRIGLACSMESPNQRMNLVDVIRELNMIKKAFHAGVRNRE